MRQAEPRLSWRKGEARSGPKQQVGGGEGWIDGSRLRGTAEDLRSQFQPTSPSSRWTAWFKPGRARHAPKPPRMYRLCQIILWILWRHRRPWRWRRTSSTSSGLASPSSPTTTSSSACSTTGPAAQKCAASLRDAHCQLDLVIHLRVPKIAGLSFHGSGFTPRRNSHHGERRPLDLRRRFRRLVHRFGHVERLAHLSEERLERQHRTARSPAGRPRNNFPELKQLPYRSVGEIARSGLLYPAWPAAASFISRS